MMEYNFYASYPKGSEIKKGRARPVTSTLDILAAPLRAVFTRSKRGNPARGDKGGAR